MSGLQIISIKRESALYGTYARDSFGAENPGSRCGEIYVGNNAKKWTFICTFCDKSVRKIDEFINHIKHAHVNFPPPLPAESYETYENGDLSILPVHHNSMKYEVPQFNPLDKTLTEFVDYNDYLDVSVQMVPEVILSDNNEQINEQVDTPAEEPTALKTRIKIEPDSEKEDIHPEIIREETTRSSTVAQPVVKSRSSRKKIKKSRRKQIKGTAYCQICKRTFQYHSLYRNHMVKHTTETPYECTVCKKGFKSKQALRYHMTTHQRDKPFKCELCEDAFPLEWQFVSHMKTHTSETNHPCEICGKINRTQCDKDIHMRTHTNDRPFACEFCLKRFRLRHHLSNHLKLHYIYRCDVCRQQFNKNIPLKKPYICPNCEVCAANLPSVIKVKQENEEEGDENSDDDEKDVTFHPTTSARDPEVIKPHTCIICNKTFANKRGLSVHISTKH